MIHPSLQILILKAQLAASDYKAIKHSEGLISEEDYAPIKAERQAIRDQINELEAQLVEPVAPPPKLSWKETILARINAQNGTTDSPVASDNE